MFKNKMNIKADFFPFNFFFYIDSFVSHDKNKESWSFTRVNGQTVVIVYTFRSNNVFDKRFALCNL